jgi:hypothetical protein
MPLIAEALPALQRPVVGTLVRSAPFDVPQLPLTAAGRSGAEQLAVVPPLLPAQLQLHGPLPLTTEAIPVEHKPLAGALLAATPLAEPQAPLPAEAPSLSMEAGDGVTHEHAVKANVGHAACKRRKQGRLLRAELVNCRG